MEQTNQPLSPTLPQELPEIIMYAPKDQDTMTVCTTILPEQVNELWKKMVERGLNVNGTPEGWVLRKDVEPTPCDTLPGRWHYECTTKR